MDRFWNKVEKTNTCWIWIASTRSGYGAFKLHGKVISAHRLVWQWNYGEIPGGLNVLHICNNRRCVNPTHLYLGTHKDNVRDSIANGTHHCFTQETLSKPRERIGRTGFKGVWWDSHKGLWKVGVWRPGTGQQTLGYFENPREAAERYDKEVVKIRGPEAMTNKSLGLL